MDSINLPSLSLASMSFFSLIMGILSFWVKRSPWIWGAFFLISICLAFSAHLITAFSIVIIISLLVLHGVLKADVKGLMRFLLVAATALISFFIYLHKISDFTSIDLTLFDHSLIYRLDFPFIGLFVLAWSFPLIAFKSSLKEVSLQILPLTIVTVIFLIVVGQNLEVISWKPHWNEGLIFWSISTLFLFIIPLEAFLRGFLQEEIFSFFGRKGLIAHTLCIVLTAAIFTLVNLFITRDSSMLMLLFVSSLCYGIIYQYLEVIESVIFCHFIFLFAVKILFNTSYPITLF